MMQEQTNGLMGAPSGGEMPQAAPMPESQVAGGMVDVKQIESGINVPANLKPMYDRIVLSGMRLLFSKDSHQLLLDQLNQPGPLAQKISDGIISLMYILWQQSNQTIPPQLMVPATTALTLNAFDYLQQTGNPEATPEVLGEALDGAVNGILQRFNVDTNNLEGAIQQSVQSGTAAKALGMQGPQGANPNAQQASSPPVPAMPGGGLMEAQGGQNG